MTFAVKYFIFGTVASWSVTLSMILFAANSFPQPLEIRSGFIVRTPFGWPVVHSTKVHTLYLTGPVAEKIRYERKFSAVSADALICVWIVTLNSVFVWKWLHCFSTRPRFTTRAMLLSVMLLAAVLSLGRSCVVSGQEGTARRLANGSSIARNSLRYVSPDTPFLRSGLRNLRPNPLRVCHNPS